jgi:hypothetical protein
MHAACARPLHAHAACANSMKRLLAIQMCPPPLPRHQKFAQKQRRRKRARRGHGPPSRHAPPPTGGGHPAGAAGCGAHAGASASLQHHDGSGRGVFRGARAPCSQSAKGYTFWPSSCSCAPPPLRVRAWYASPLLAPATSLSIILIACSPLLPPQRHRPGPLRALLYVCFGGQLAGTCSACRRSNGVRAM